MFSEIWPAGGCGCWSGCWFLALLVRRCSLVRVLVRGQDVGPLYRLRQTPPIPNFDPTLKLIGIVKQFGTVCSVSSSKVAVGLVWDILLLVKKRPPS